MRFLLLAAQQSHRRLAALILISLYWAAGATAAERKPMRLCAEILSYSLERPEYESFVQTLERAVDEYGIGEIMIHGFDINSWLTHSDFPKVKKSVDPERVAHFRKQLQRFKKRGLRITLSGAGPRVPDGFFEAYPEARIFPSGQFQHLLRTGTEELFRTFPEADAMEIYLWETPLLNDLDFFTGMGWAESHQKANVLPTAYYGPADLVSETLTAYARGAQDAGRQFVFLTFSHYPWQENLIVDALKRMDRRLPVVLDHKNQPGDWSPYRPANNVMLQVTDREAMMLFDGTGEYWGQSLMPYCYPEEIQQRLQHALRNNPSIDALGMRVLWAGGRAVFGNPNEVNFYALSRLAKNPDTPIEEIWRDWAEKRFGKAAAPKVISALERTNQIANLVYYIRGVWVHNHSALSGLQYLESHFLQYAKSAAEWNPADFRTAALLRELVENPRERTVRWVVADRDEALRLNALSLADIESAKPGLAKGDYEKLRAQLVLQRDFAEVSIPHIEAFLRYRIQKQRPGAENREKFEAALAVLEKQAGEIRAKYGESNPFLSARLILAYVNDVRAAFPKP